MATNTWSKKSPGKSTYIEPKVHIVATWGTIKQKIFRRPVFPELVISYEVRNFEVYPVTKILSS